MFITILEKVKKVTENAEAKQKAEQLMENMTWVEATDIVYDLYFLGDRK